MPEISRFFGIRIGSVRGRFPPRALGLVMEWYHLHRKELLADWDLAVALKPLEKIEPLR